jgi:hypothetical protein
MDPFEPFATRKPVESYSKDRLSSRAPHPLNDRERFLKMLREKNRVGELPADALDTDHVPFGTVKTPKH